MQAKNIIGFIFLIGLTSLPLTTIVHADTMRMQSAASLVGIDELSQSQESKRAEEMVERLVALGLKAYPSLKIREAQLLVSRAEVEAAHAAFQPNLQVSADGTQSRSKDLINNFVSHNETQGLSLSLRENIWRGGQDSGRLEIAKLNESLAAIQHENQIESLSFSIRKAALDYNFRSLRQILDEASLADAVELSSLAQRNFKARQIGKIDIYTASMRESSAQSQAARAAIQTRQALQNLISLLGPQPDLESLQKEIKILSQRILPFPTQTPELGNEKVLSFDEKNAVTLQKRAELSLEQSYRLRFLPQIDFVGILTQTQNKSWLDESSEAKTKRRNYDSNLQLQVTWNLWDRSQDFRIQAAVAEKTAALAQADSSRYQVQNEAVRLQNYILDLHKSLSIAKEAYVRAGQLYDAQLRLFETGVIGIQALVDSERERRSAITAWHETVYELQLNILQWQSFQRGFLGGLGTKSES